MGIKDKMNMNISKEYKIIEVRWRSALHTVGFVAYDIGFDDVWNAVVGYVPGISLIPTDPPAIVIHTGTEDDDAQYIAAHGAKLSWQEAQIGTIIRLETGQSVSDRYLLGLAWFMRDYKEKGKFGNEQN